MNSNNKRVAVALSGGVDSSVVALLLKQQGYDVVGVTAKMVNDYNFSQVVENARDVANKLEIEYHVVDLSAIFKEKIIEYFENSYAVGKTPNPCILCNKHIKWGELFEYCMNNLSVDFFATGHYANIVYNNGFYELYPAKDEKKDQLYYLFELSQEQLSKTIFPLANYQKSEIKEIALRYNLPSKSAKESQDICFISYPLTTKKYLHERFGNLSGDFILKSTGEKLGVHNGFFEYTIGQRKGIGIAYKEPLYVVDLDPKRNIVYLGVKADLYSRTLKTDLANINSYIETNEFYAMVKIRYNMQAVPAVVKFKNSVFEIEFEEPVSAVTKGQAAVVYSKKDGHLIGGAWIS